MRDGRVFLLPKHGVQLAANFGSGSGQQIRQQTPKSSLSNRPQIRCVRVPRPDGFIGDGAVNLPADADHRAMALATGPDGSLYITDDAGGRIWRVLHASRKP
jgi:glucose/arabinose dehydrogenase